MTDLELKIKAIIAKTLDCDESEIGPDTNFVDDLLADSLDLVEMIMETEHCFKISIPDNKVDDLRTFRKLVEYVKSRI
jgi:acyl carrier protein